MNKLFEALDDKIKIRLKLIFLISIGTVILESLSIINLNQLGLACINAESYELASKYLELALEKDPNYHNSSVFYLLLHL